MHDDPRVTAAGRTRTRRTPWIWSLPALLTAVVVNLPLIYIFVRAGDKGWQVYRQAIFSPLIADLLGRTGLLVAGTVAVALAIALPAAWLVVRTDLPGRRLWAVLAALPIVFPSYVSAFTLIAVLGPRGYLQGWLEPLGIDLLPQVAYGYSGALLALALFTYPYLFLPLVATLRQLDPALEESARSLGAGRWRSFREVVLPQLRPALLAGSLLVALYVLSDFGAVSIVRYNTFTLSIYNAYGTLIDRTAAAALATVLVVLTLVLIAWEARLSNRSRPSRHRPARPPQRVALGVWRWPSLLFVGTLAAFTVLLPSAVVTFWGVRGLLVGRLPGRGSAGEVGEAMLHSLTVSGLAAVVAVILSLPIVIWAVRHPGRLSRGVERLTYAGYALPGLVIALSLVFFSIRYARPLYQTLPLLTLAYVIRFLPQATASTRSALLSLSPVFEEAARSLGKSPIQVLHTLVLPLILPGILTGAGLVFLTSMKELPATLLLRPTGFETLATEIWSYASEAIFAAASLPALALVLVTAPPLYLLVIRPVLAERRVSSRTLNVEVPDGFARD